MAGWRRSCTWNMPSCSNPVICVRIKATIFGFYLLFIIRIHISYPSPCSSFILLQSAVPPLRSMFSNRIFCFVSLVLLSLVCGQTLGYTIRNSGQKYLVKTGNKYPEKHLLVETEDADYDPEEYDSAEGNIYCSRDGECPAHTL